jgi:hypothetical protein
MDGIGSMAIGQRCRRGKLALFAASAVLATGAQALAPTPVAALNDEGNECQNLPAWEASTCEMENRGGSGVGGVGGGAESGARDGEVIGEETIEVHDTRPPDPPPSPCKLSPWSCGPNSGRPQAGRSGDGGRPYAARPPRKPTRAAQAPKQKSNPPTREECDDLGRGNFKAVQSVPVLRALQRPINTKTRELEDDRQRWVEIGLDIEDLIEKLRELRKDPHPDGDVILAREGRLMDLHKELSSVIEEFQADSEQLAILTEQRDGLQVALLDRCRRLYPGSLRYY